MAQSSRPSLVSIASAYVSDESNVVCVLHACTYAQACVHDLCTVIEGWEAWILHTSGANRRRIINALTQTSLKRTLSLIVGVGLTLLHWIRLVVFDSFLFLLFFWKIFDVWNCQRILCFLLFDIGLIEVGIELIGCRLFFSFSFPGYNFSFRNIRNGNFVWNLKIDFKFDQILKKIEEEWIDEISFSSEFRSIYLKSWIY